MGSAELEGEKKKECLFVCQWVRDEGKGTEQAASTPEAAREQVTGHLETRVLPEKEKRRSR